MRFARTRVLLAAGVLAAAATGTAAVLAGGAAASPASGSVVLVQCNGHAQVKPGKTDQPCMPSQEFFTGLKWTSWKSVAYGSGTIKVNNCTPSCANGKFIGYPILTVLWRAEPRPGHAGQEYFTRLTFIFTGKRSNHGPAARTVTLKNGQS
jgi:hypothetical protein